MNKIYKVIWSKVTQSFVVVSELASSQGKAKSSVVNQQSKLSSLLSICFQLSAVAIPLFSTIQTASATSIAIGATSSSNNATNNGSTTKGADSIAIGNASTAIGPGSIAIGANATANITDKGDRSQGAVAIGAFSVANGNQSVALGDKALALGTQSSAIGNNAAATGFGSIVIGGDDTGYNKNNPSIIDPYSYNTLGLAIGYMPKDDTNSYSNYRTPVSSGVGSVVVGVHGQALSNGSTAIGVYATAGDNGAEIPNSSTSTTAIEATAVGAFARARDTHSTAIGYKANSFGENSTAIGSLAQTDGTNATAIGLDTKASANDSIAIGTGDNVTGKMSGAIGGSTTVNANNSYSLGNSNTIKAGADNTFVVGNNVSSAMDPNSVILGNGSSGTETVNSTNSATINTITYSTFAGVGSQAKGYVSVGSSGNERQIKNVAAGEISATSTDAINGSQLYVVADTLSKKIPTVVAGANTNVASSSTTTGTTYTVNAYNTTATAGSTYVNVTEKVTGYNISYAIDLNQTTKDTIVTANTTAHAANATANKANTTANLANTTANTANGTANTANTTANMANTTANTANGTANVANTTANTANTTANNANGTANTANNTANVANKTANTANTTANTANTTANAANTTANIANATVNKGWNITTSASDGSATNTTDENVQMGENVTIDAGQNINITQSGQKISIATSMTPTFTSATFGGTTINSDGLTITNGPSITTSGINASNKTITNLANGVNNSDAVNKGQLEVVNTTANAANTTANTANTTANTANTTANTANGTANTANTTANTANTTANAANTTANIANATVNKGWNITTSQSKGSATSTTNENVQMGETVTIDAGQNINITQNGQNISIATSMTPTFTSATFGGTTINSDGLTITNGPSVTTSGINAGNKTITNLANGVNNSDAVNKGQLEVVNTTANAANTTANTANGTANTANTTANTANTTANAANTTANAANATVNKGWNITTSASTGGSVSGTENKNVQMGETVTIDAGQNINITQAGQKISIATSMTPTFTSATFGGTTINSDGLTITNGPSVTTSGINAGNKTITNLANGVNNSDAVNKGQLEVVNTTANAANTTANTANGTANTANTTANTANTTANTANGTANTANTTANTANGTANTANTTANAANTTANIANATVNKGWNITTSASDGSATNTTDENVQMGENVTIDAGQNINITQNGQKISIATSMTPTFTSAKFGDTLIQNDGLTIVGGPSITKSGINAGSKTITNVADGVNATDAVNKGQLDAVNTTANTANNTANTANNTANTANTTANAANTTANAANATVNKGWNITTSQSTGGSVSGNDSKNVQMGDTVTIDAGQNINITQSDKKISIATSMTPTFTSATFGGTLINSDGLTITAGPSITKSGVNAGNKNITNVATPIAGTDAANKDYVDNVKLNYAGDNSTSGSNKLTDTVTFAGTEQQIVTTAENGKVSFKLADEVNASLSKADSALQSFTVGADKGTNATINNTSTHFNIVGTPNYVNTTVNGQNITVDIAQSFKDTVTNNTQNISNNAQNITNNANNITNNTNNITNNTNNITKNTGDIANNTQNITKNATEIAKGFGLKAQDGQEITKALGEKVEVIGGNDNINTSVANGKIQVNLNNTLNLTNAGSVTVGNSTINDNGLNITNGTTTVSLTEKGLDNGNQTITHVANGTNGTDAVNKNQLDAVNATAHAGWNFNTSGNVTTSNVAPSSTVTFNGDKNVNVTHNGSTLNVSLNNTVDLGTSGSLKVNSTTINSNGTISGVTNGTLSTTSTEAVNGSQLFATNQNVANNTQNIANNTATINKGTMYGGDIGNAFTLKLGEQANVKGGISDTTALTDNNLGVVSDGTNTLMVKLAKELTNLTSATFGNDTTDKTVINKDGVTITNGTDTISLTENGLDNGNKTITNVAAGVNDTDAVNKAQLDAVTTTANAGWKLQANGTNESTVAPNDTVSLNNTDKNIVISKETTDDNVTFNLAKDLTGLTSATFGDTSINNDGLTIKDGPNVTKSGIDAANTKITNVTDGAVNATSKDAVNGSQLYATNQNVTNLNTTVSKGLTFNTTDTSTEFNRKLGDTITINGGADANAATAAGNIKVKMDNGVISLDLLSNLTNLTSAVFTNSTNNSTVTGDGITVTNGTNTTSLTVNGLDNGNNTITHVANGTNGTDAVNFDQLKAVNATANAGWNFNTSGNVTKTNVAPNNTVTFNGDSNINVTHNGSTLNVSLNNTVDLGTSGSLKVNSTTINSNGTISGVTNGTLNATSTEAVNGSQLFATNQNVTNNANEIAKGTVYGGDTGTSFTRQLGEQTNVKGGITEESKLSDNNLGVVSDNTNNTLMVKLAKELTNLTSATFGSDTDKTVINKDGVTITNGTDTISLTENGLDNGNKTITNVAAGVNDTDAVNKAQLDAVTTTANAGWKLQANGTNESTVTPNETVSLNNTDNNIVISKDSSNDNVTFNLAKNLTGLTSATFGDTSINDNGLTINNGPSITKSGIDAANTKITNVTDGAVDANSKDAVNGSQLYATNQNISNVSSNVSNNTAEIAKGWNLTTSANGGAVSGNSTEQINMGETISFIAGKNVNLTQATNNITIATADNVTFTNVTLGDTTKTTDGLVTLTKEGLTVTNGTSTVNLTTSGLDNGNQTITHVANGTNGTDAVNKNQLDAVNATANAGWNFNTSGNATASNVTPNSTVTFKGDSNINVTHNGSDLTVSLNKDVNLGTDGSLKVNSTTINNNGTISGVTNGTLNATSTEAVNGSQLFATNQNVTNNTQNIANNTATINKGTVYGGDIGTNFTRKLGEQTNVKGGITDESKLSDNNLGVVSDNTNNTLMVKLAKDLNLTSDGSVTMGDTLLNSTGLTITNGPSVTNNGIQAGNKQITNVSSGLGGTVLKDASGDTLKNVANIGDLQTVINNVTNASAGGGFGLTDDKGDKVTQDLGKTIALNGKDGITVTANTASDGLEIGLGNNVTIGSKDGVAGIVNVKDKDGDDTITLDAENATVSIGSDGLPGSIGLDGTNGTIGIIGKDGTSASITVTDGAKGLAGNDGLNGDSKTRITYTKSDGMPEEVATLNDGLFFTGDDTNVTVGKKLNETLTIKGNLSQTANVTDQNLRVDVVDNALVIKMAKELRELTNATFISGNSQSVLDGNGFTITSNVAGKNPVSLTDNGLDNGGNVISNVGAGVADTDAVNMSQLNAVNATANAGWNFNTSGNTTTTNVAPNSTVTFNGDKNINVTHDGSNLNVSLNNTVDLGANGSMKIGNTTVDNNGLTVGNTTVTDNGLTIAGGPSVTQAGIDAGNKKLTGVLAGDISATSTDAINGAQIYQVEQNVKAAKTEVEAGNNVNVSTTTGKNGQTVYTVATASDVDFDKVTVGDVTISKNSGINAGNHQVANVANGSISADSKDAVNGSQLYATNQNVTNLGQEVAKGWNVTTSKVDGSTGTVTGNSTTKVAMGDTVSVKAGNNIAITQDGKNIAIATSMTPTFDSVTVGTKGNSAKIGTTTDNYGNAISVTGDDGVSPTRITNVAAGQADNDAVNVSQVRNMANHINSSINKVDKNLRAGIAGAMAAGNLYHVTLPGKSMVAAGAGVYKGEGAVAVGYSRLSDNGKIGIKFSVNSNTRGDTGAAASVGYQW
ncbi:ESPR-type extended signal peptide-containing protein [Lonepinella sp. MS14436]|uniref:ESPR-type extended signal peptide-containing protein n=1 Tax=Lonepinella sp. MS14436 TaxID=3003619 RepID=UPI0036DC8CC0